MPIVRPNYGERTAYEPVIWTPGRMVAKVAEIKESDKTDKQGNNALVFRFEIVKSDNASLVGKQVSKWFPLGGPGAKALWRCLKTLNSEYDGREFDTRFYIGKKLEVEVELSPEDKDGKTWPRIRKVYPFFELNDIAPTLKGNVMDVVGLVDDFDV